MYKEIKILRQHGIQYVKDLRRQPVSELFRGRPVISADITGKEIEIVSSLCPSGAIDDKSGAIDLGRCVFCRECEFCLREKIRFTNDYRIACSRREDLVISPGVDTPLRFDGNVVREEIRKIFRRSLKLRQVSAGGDNSCEMELNAAGNVNFDLGRHGVEFVASPRHADGIVITGPVSANMAEALRLTYEAVPDPKVIILAGTDAISGGMYAASPAIDRRFIEEHHIDLYVPGNPAHPLTFINGILDLLSIA
ncbi:MAG TPA: NADH:ubiquinone oxidoreductase [Bacteroidales bacterium]|jgi:Ni,Fe-hydrogenase III small subunit|nr:NADH:ubiquinone oxidoreductase [Bacteroidales bacterium]HNY51857.1 NADH:ubiquinone oxidoreductase [Bacteroidales bacterium]HOG55996.1 NADH:ubiquinone oxidoreductase [Bacteroidales bacterium]HPX43039.1 NADH:ubiquinone oxidoreductase [Bacteroidales bacterium]HQB85863.1 NADH:ubiquinone oxidoreductase [Bacteroidales bacterium]